MSLNLKSSGGGSVTVDVPSTASNYTATLPAATGTVMVSGNQPAFSAYIGTTQSVTSGAATKIAFDTEEFDTNSCYDTANYRFTPTVAGYYQVNLTAYMATNAAGTSAGTYIYKNGSAVLRNDLRYTSSSSTLYGIPSLSGIVYLNGTTDYIEAYGFITATTPSFANTASISKFSGALVRAA